MLPPDYPITDNYLTADEVYGENVDLEATPPGSANGRKLLRGQGDDKQNGLYVAEDPGNGAVWVRRLCPASKLYVLVGVGLDVGRNVGAGPYLIDGTAKTWGTDSIAVARGWA